MRDLQIAKTARFGSVNDGITSSKFALVRTDTFSALSCLDAHLEGNNRGSFIGLCGQRKIRTRPVLAGTCDGASIHTGGCDIPAQLDPQSCPYLYIKKKLLKTGNFTKRGGDDIVYGILRPRASLQVQQL